MARLLGGIWWSAGALGRLLKPLGGLFGLSWGPLGDFLGGLGGLLGRLGLGSLVGGWACLEGAILAILRRSRGLSQRSWGLLKRAWALSEGKDAFQNQKSPPNSYEVIPKCFQEVSSWEHFGVIL